MAQKADAVGFYVDEDGKTRPITKKNVTHSLLSGIKVNRTFKAVRPPMIKPKAETIEKLKTLERLKEAEIQPSGLILGYEHVVGLVADPVKFRESDDDFATLAALTEGGGGRGTFYPRVYISRVRKYDYYRIGQSTVKGKYVKTVLRVIGPKNLTIYHVGEDKPVMFVNDVGEAMVLAPAVGRDVRGTIQTLPTRV